MRITATLLGLVFVLAPISAPVIGAEPAPTPTAEPQAVDLELLPASLYRAMLERDILETRSRFAENAGRREEAYELQLRVVEIDQDIHGPVDSRSIQSLMRLIAITGTLESAIPDQFQQRTLDVIGAILESSAPLIEGVPDVAMLRATLRTVKEEFVSRGTRTEAQRRAITQAQALADQARTAVAGQMTETGARLFREALAVIEQQFDPESGTWATAAMGAADGLWMASEPDEALALFVRALPVFTSAYGESAPYLIQANWVDRLIERASAQSQQRQWSAAGDLLKHALALRTDRYGGDHAMVQDVEGSLAHLERRRILNDDQLTALETAEAKLPQAEAAMQTTGLLRSLAVGTADRNAREAWETLKSLLGAEDVLTIRASRLRVALANEQDDEELRLQLHRDLANAVERVKGRDHPETQGALDQLTGQLAAGYFTALREGQFDEARSLAAERHALNVRRYSEQGWQSRNSSVDVQTAELLSSAGPEQHARWVRARGLQDEVVATFKRAQFRENIPRAEEVVALDEEVLGPEHPTTALSIANLAAQYRELGERDKAVELYENVRRIREQSIGKQHPDYVEVLTNIGYAHNQVGDSDKALPVLQEAVEIARTVSQYSYGDALRTQAYTYRNNGQIVQAEAAFREAAGILATAAGPHDFVALMTADGWGIQLRTMGRYQEAIEQLRRVTEGWKATQGDRNYWYGDSMNSLGVSLYFAGRYDEAIPIFEQALPALEQSAGTNSAEHANLLANLAMATHRAGREQESQNYVERYLANRRRAFGERSPQYVNVLVYIGSSQLFNVGPTKLLTAAEAEFAKWHLSEAARLAIEVAGEDSALHADVLMTLGVVHRVRNEFDEAIALLERAVATCERQSGPEHESTIDARNSLASAYSWSGDFARALALYRENFDRCQRARNSLPGHTIALVRRELGGCLIGINDLNGAEAHLRESLNHYRSTLGDHHPNYVAALAYLAQVYLERNELEFAERVFQECLTIQKNTFGADTPDYASRLLDVATVERKLGRLDAAEEHTRHAASVLERLGDALVPHISARLQLVDVLLDAGKFDEAETVLASAREQVQETLGPQHERYVGVLRREGLLAFHRGERAAAADRFDQAVVASGRNADLAMAAQSERQRLVARKTLEDDLSLYLSATDSAPQSANSAYRLVMSFKGAVFASQAHQRLVRSRPELAGKFQELEETSRRIATLTLSRSSPEDRAATAAELRDLTGERERLEIELASQSGLSESSHAFGIEDVDALLERLPPEVVVVDLLEYTHSRIPDEAPGALATERRIVAFVLSSTQGVARVELGARDDIAAAVEAFRKAVLEQQPQSGPAAPGMVLRSLVWAPIAPLIGNARHVLISPDGATARIPFAGLPSAEPETFLVEEVGIAVVPFPRLLLEGGAVQEGDHSKAEPQSLLLVGDVDFLGEAGKSSTAVATRSALVRGNRRSWTALPATRTEALAVRDSFETKYEDGTAEFLRGSRATEGAFCESATGHRWIHVATHGFFAPPEEPAGDAEPASGSQTRAQFDVEGFHPGLLSGLVFAGANSESDSGQDDGILTALEIAQLDLARTEMVVLSACETGLGEAAGGEGLLGLQRAFQVAGVRTTVASLWIVNDLATRRLMERFYANLWDPEKRMSKLDALREAQLWMLNDPEQARGATPGDDSAARSPPFFWASFQLSGDWR